MIKIIKFDFYCNDIDFRDDFEGSKNDIDKELKEDPSESFSEDEFSLDDFDELSDIKDEASSLDDFN